MKKHTLFILLAVAAVGTAISMLPWEVWVKERVQSEMARRGLGQVDFTIDSIGLTEVVLTDIRLQHGLPLSINMLVIDYSLADLLRGRPDKIHASEIWVSLGKRTVAGYDAALAFVPAPSGVLQATWLVREMQVAEIPLELPPLAGSGTALMEQEKIKVDGSFSSQDKSTQTTFSVHYDRNDAAHSRLVLHTFLLPWGGGKIVMREAIFPLSAGKESTITLQVQSVSLSAVLDAATQHRAQATGTISGSVPVTVRGQAPFTVHNGRLAAEGPGIITLAPDAIPGDNAQLALVREVLGNFHYRQLTMEIDSDKDRKLSLMLRLEGNNPNAYGGKPVKLNVHLTGDVLSFLQQSVMPLADPQQLLKQDTP